MSENSGAMTKVPAKKKRGRRSLLNEKLIKEFCGYMEEGHTLASASHNCNISEETTRVWKLRAEEENEGRDWDDPDAPLSLHQQFLEGIRRAEEKYKAGRLKLIRTAANEGNWQAAGWECERRWKAEFGRNEIATPLKVEHSLSPWLQAALESAQSRQLAPMEKPPPAVDAEFEDVPPSE